MMNVSKSSHGKLRAQDQVTQRLLALIPWILTGLATVPLPVFFFALFIVSTSSDSAAFYLLLSLSSLGLGILIGLVIMLSFWLYRRRWSRQLRARLAADGITASEVSWFRSELSFEEKSTWRELQRMNPLLADAYCETLATRLTATRIASRAKDEVIRIERQINRARHLRDADTSSLMKDLIADRHEAELVRRQARLRQDEAKARLHTIYAVARRALSQTETALMLERLSAAQDQSPLGLELSRLEQEARDDLLGRTKQ